MILPNRGIPGNFIWALLYSHVCEMLLLSGPESILRTFNHANNQSFYVPHGKAIVKFESPGDAI